MGRLSSPEDQTARCWPALPTILRHPGRPPSPALPRPAAFLNTGPSRRALTI